MLHKGKTVAFGSPSKVLTVTHIEQVFGISACLMHTPETGAPLLVPLPGQIRQPSGNSPVSPYSDI